MLWDRVWEFKRIGVAGVKEFWSADKYEEWRE